MDDLTIIELYFDRSEQAIDETDKKYGKLCRSLAGSILSSDEDAEECVSDAYLSVWNTIPPTRPNNFTAFLCRIVRNLSLKRLDYNTAQKRNGNVTVPLAELEYERFIYVYRLAIDAMTRKGDDVTGRKWPSLLEDFQTATTSVTRKRHHASTARGF